jgi:hypothetical protein
MFFQGDLPSWLVKAMTTLLLWDNETGLTDENFPKFKDVFTEVNNYFIDLKEPLLTKELSHLFIKILDLLITPTVSSTSESKSQNKQNGKPNKNKHTTRSEEQQMLEDYDEIVRLFVTSVVCMCEYEHISEQTVEKVIEILKEQMITNQIELDDLNLENKCISYQLLDAILCISSDKTTNNYDLFERVESNLIKNAKLPFMNESETLNNENKINDEFDEENEYLLQNLLLASLARLENCCDECLNTYNEINNLLNIKPNEYDDYISNMNGGNVDLLTQQLETTTFLNTTTSVNLLQQEKLKTAYLNEILMRNENEDDLASATSSNNQMNTNNIFFNAFLDDENNAKRNQFASKKLHRNNSFRAAIGDIQPSSKLNRCAEPVILESTANETASTTASNFSYENDDRLFKMPTPKRLTRSVTNSMNSDYKNKTIDETPIETSSYNHILSSSISSATLPLTSNNRSNDEGFKFKLPFDPPPAPPPKSTSMNFNQTIIEPSPTVNKLNKKRKLANNVSSMGISHSTSFNFGINENYSLLSTFKSVSRLSRQNTLYQYNNNKVTPSFSLTTLNQINKHNNNFSSLKNLAQIERFDDDEYENSNGENTNNQYKLLSTLSLNELSSFIRSNMRASYNLNDFNNLKDSFKKLDNNNDHNSSNKETEEERKFKITLSTEIDSEIFYFIISAFRLCALMLPPTNKRKLHLLLRFLNKLKHNKHTAKYLLNQNEHIFDDLNFIDTSNITNQSLNLSNNNNNNNSNNSKLLKMSLNHDLENKSNAIESVIIKSFSNSIVNMDKASEDSNIDNDLREQLVVKLVQILINNYTEIMRIPEDLISNIKYKINTIKLNAEPIASSTVNSSTTLCDLTASNHSKLSSSNKYCSKISLQQYDKQKAEQSKKHLTNLLNNILTDVNMKENEKLIRLRKFKESHPQIYEEKYPTIKKALSILGINETIDNNFNKIDNSNSGFSNNTNSREDFESIKKKVFLSNFAENLNQTTTLFSNSRGFQKLFNKKKK